MFIILIIIFTNIDLTISEQNISHGKPVSICGIFAEALTDGNRLGVNTFNTNEGCNKLTFKINIEAGHLLKYMIIFTGERGSVSTPDHGLNHLQIFCEHENSLTPCAAISTRMNMIKRMEKGIRVNFMHETATALHLDFPSTVWRVRLSEIEVYPREGAIYRGCYESIGGSRTDYVGYQKCKDDCRDHRAFGIMQPFQHCICMYQIDTGSEVSFSNCNLGCPDYPTMCGGGRFASVHITNFTYPTFLGCYPFDAFKRDAGELELEIPIRDLTFGKCMRFCGGRNAFFWKGKCGCGGNVNVNFSHQPSLCDIPCEFNEENACGGESGVSLYQTCFVTVIIPCLQLLNCKRARFDHNGVCTDGCKSGFDGPHCIAKVSNPSGRDERDEPIEMIGDPITEPTTIPEATEEPTTTVTQEKSSSTVSSTETNITTHKTISVGVMVDYIFSIWVAACYMSIHCATYD